jgi:hypothetical protein
MGLACDFAVLARETGIGLAYLPGWGEDSPMSRLRSGDRSRARWPGQSRVTGACLVAVAGFWCWSIGCNSGGDSADEFDWSSPDATLSSYEPCDAASRVGAFIIELGDGFTSVRGQVYDAVTPRDVPVEVAAEGDCRLFTAPTMLCNPVCDVSQQVCAPGNQCQPRPQPQDLGRVSVRGLRVPLRMEANVATKAYANPASAGLPHPGFEPGASVELTSAGGPYGPISLLGWGVSSLEGVAELVPVRTGAPLELLWQPPPDAGPARIHLNLNINHHGSSSNWIECDAPDVGAAAVPAALIDALLERGRSGYPTLTVTRRSVSSVVIEPGCVELQVAATTVSDVQLEGLQSCSGPADCAPGQRCLPEFYCQ